MKRLTTPNVRDIGTLLAAVILLAACAAPARPQVTDLAADVRPREPIYEGVESYQTPTTVPRRNPPTTRASRSHRASPAQVAPAPKLPVSATGETRRVSSTAYCLTGTMASGKRVYSGAVAMNGVPFGSRWYAVELGRTFTVEDRIGHSSQFDIAMPGDCAGARQYGRRTLTIRRVG